jgi:hypothetical protein
MKQTGTEHGRDWSRRFERAEIVAMVVVIASAGLFHVTERVNQFFVANADNLLVAPPASRTRT